MTDLPDSPRSIGEIARFHAHVYYDPASTRPEAERLCSWTGARCREVGAAARDRDRGGGRRVGEQVADRRRVERGDRLRIEAPGSRQLREQGGVKRIAGADGVTHHDGTTGD